MLYADNTWVVSISARGLTRMIDVIVVADQEFGLTVSEKKTKAIHLWSNPSTASSALRIESLGLLSTRARTSTPGFSVASAPLGRVSEDIVPTCTTNGTPGCHSRLGY